MLQKDNLVENLLGLFPELRFKFEEEARNYEEDYSKYLHLVFGDIFNPYLIRVLKEDEISNEMKKAFIFLEDMALSKDEAVINVLVVTVLEYLGDDKRLLSKAREHMGKNTRLLSVDIENYLGRE